MTSLDRLFRRRMALILDEPFFGMLLMNLRLVEDPALDPPTMCTNGEDLRFHPGFVAECDDPKLTFVLAHEVLHCALGHIHRRGVRDPERFNIAADFAVNNFLGNCLAAPGLKGYSGVTVPDDALVNHAWDHLSAEEIYALLPESQKKEDGGGQAGTSGGSQPGDKDPPGEGEPRPDQQGRFEDAPGSESQQRHSEETWKARLTEAAMTAEAHGRLPASIRRFIDRLFNPELPWTEILRNHLRARARDNFTWRKPNKKTMGTDFILPSLHSERMGEIVVAVDTSGSIDREQLRAFLSEAQGILDECRPSKLIVLDCDAEVHQAVEFEPGDPGLCDFEPQGGGGTNFAPVFDWIEEHGVDPVIVVYLTDLCGTFPDPVPAWDTLWVQYGSASITPPFGEHIKIPPSLP
jgi:predicted metal-dependent peptidase